MRQIRRFLFVLAAPIADSALMLKQPAGADMCATQPVARDTPLRRGAKIRPWSEAAM